MRALLICLIVTFGLAGCGSKPPHTTVPNVGKVIGDFREARDTCYAYASIAKARVVLPRRLQEGQNNYAKARGSHNKVITSIVVAIETNKPLSKKSLNALLAQADADRRRFAKWYAEVPGRRQSHVAEHPLEEEGATASVAAPTELVVSLTDLAVELLKLQEARFAEERKQLRTELRNCEWEDWDSIGTVR